LGKKIFGRWKVLSISLFRKSYKKIIVQPIFFSKNKEENEEVKQENAQIFDRQNESKADKKILVFKILFSLKN